MNGDVTSESVMSAEEVAELNAAFEAAEPAKILAWAAGRFGKRLVMSSSFGADSAVLLHLAQTAMPGIKVIFVNTGYLFPETHGFMEQLRLKLDLNVWIYRTKNDPIAWLQKAGEGSHKWRNDIAACCAANKNEPFERAMKELVPTAWLRGIRRNQAESRKAAAFVEYAPRYGCYAISPLLKWTSREIHGYLKAHDLPYHPLVEKGYMSVGCNPESCTRPITLGEDSRSGRWAGTGKLECGINVVNSLDSSNL
jgi:phosphoadenosine phosphosulfate reductase